MKNVDLWGGGGRNKEFGPFGERNFKYGHVYTKSLENRHIMAKILKIERFFARLLDYKRSYLHLRRRRKEISEIFLNKRSKIALKKTILRDLVPNCGPLAGVGWTNPPNSTSLRPCFMTFDGNFRSKHCVIVVTRTMIYKNADKIMTNSYFNKSMKFLYLLEPRCNKYSSLSRRILSTVLKEPSESVSST